jgi:protein-S-isoprenylcysteine O-methyltransferase Ste14
MRLFTRILKSVVIGILVIGALIFIPAGTFAYWQGWSFLAAFLICNIIIGIYLTLKDPALLERRKKVGPAAEKRLVQKIIISLCFVIFVGLLIFSVLDHRFRWSEVPLWASMLGNALVVLGLMTILRVFRENTYGASTIEMMESQKVITSGPYALVRHPMYVGVLIMAAGVPPALGSWWGLLFGLAIVPVLMLRIIDEETMLRGELEGYDLYMRDVRYRLVPGVW